MVEEAAALIATVVVVRGGGGGKGGGRLVWRLPSSPWIERSGESS